MLHSAPLTFTKVSFSGNISVLLLQRGFQLLGYFIHLCIWTRLSSSSYYNHTVFFSETPTLTAAWFPGQRCNEERFKGPWTILAVQRSVFGRSSWGSLGVPGIWSPVSGPRLVPGLWSPVFGPRSLVPGWSPVSQSDWQHSAVSGPCDSRQQQGKKQHVLCSHVQSVSHVFTAALLMD